MEQFAKYIGVPGILALSMTFALIAWVSLGIVVPDFVYGLVGAGWGYYFGTNGKVIYDEHVKGGNDVA